MASSSGGAAFESIVAASPGVVDGKVVVDGITVSVRNMANTMRFCTGYDVSGVGPGCPGACGARNKARSTTVKVCTKAANMATALIFATHMTVTGVSSILAGIRARDTIIAMFATYAERMIISYDFTATNIYCGFSMGGHLDCALIGRNVPCAVYMYPNIVMTSFRCTYGEKGESVTVNAFPSGGVVIMGIKAVEHIAAVSRRVITTLRPFVTLGHSSEERGHMDGVPESRVIDEKQIEMDLEAIGALKKADGSSPSSSSLSPDSPGGGIREIMTTKLKPGRQRKRRREEKDF